MEYNNRLKFLLRKYLSEDLSAEEHIEFSQWIENLEQQQLYDLYDEVNTTDPFFENLEIGYAHDRVLQSIHREIKPFSKSTYPFRWLAAAAVAAIFLFFIRGDLFFVPVKKDKTPVAFQPDSSIPILDSSSTVLRLADGEVIDLKQQNQSSVYYKNGCRIDFIAGGGIRYALAPAIPIIKHKNVGMNIFSTKRGATSNIILEDGTRVWLNSGSSLKFPVSFTGGTDRTVEVVGEAYFEVAHNQQKPFIVVSNYSKVTVLGTKFNIKAYPNQNQIQTTLLQGSVRINSSNASSLLVPGEQAIVRKSGNINRSNVNVEDFIAWKTGLIYFNNLSVEEIVGELSHWFDIRGIDNRSLNRDRYTGSFNKNKTIVEILSQLEKISNNHFTIKERRVLIRD
ncbi:FecR family protein [Sphingobacterium athyrii]|uniref:Anti-sigma factor n=1 Tax=Sphingobacterium athyrii TaxID=2152717 RepID=A0A363NVD1_9SPHI|nr:FecR domain-containing protein [Sphingobacterium athyrii]PUV24754.1 hypothetical protein DCO56_07210 [Sphingobacterium athyrii]